MLAALLEVGGESNLSELVCIVIGGEDDLEVSEVGVVVFAAAADGDDDGNIDCCCCCSGDGCHCC